MEELKSKEIQPIVWSLLSFATSEKNIDQEYRAYMELPNRKLFAYMIEDEIVGCIGIELLGQERCEIRHIAVLPSRRKESIESKMINFILEKYSLAYVLAETDNEAVNFYKKYGFKSQV
ncbi:GNAT family N-acetyltransferase [Pullulanibacillus sp. KACC 23026]|uniref:GNAT family N-acetyltransferase n=1 Tax=Pullulanibacillus sp. KACC 23026 TaxID=3028315 RepID=UPI0023AE7746|nr:GNAT family N-acetyltransferase [Pullulanibacillus sp. KACC 23026]WEG12423.1 GNAT family N-acetyltransferase [Pullulanibacillus sp. KACC 23026]